MRKTITILLYTLLICSMGYWVTPTYAYSSSGDGHYTLVFFPIEWFCRNWLGVLVLLGLALLFLFPAFYMVFSYRKHRPMLLALAGNLLSLILITYLLWGLYYSEIEDNFRYNKSLVGMPHMGLYLPILSIAITVVIFVLVLIEHKRERS